MVKGKDIKVVVGLTNSADSKVAAYLLNQQGYEVMGVTFLYGQKKNQKGSTLIWGCLITSVIFQIPRKLKIFAKSLEYSTLFFLLRTSIVMK